MRVPQALLDKYEELRRGYQDAIGRVREAADLRDLAEIKLEICEEAIALVEGAEIDPQDTAIFQPALKPPPPEIVQASLAPVSHSPGRARRRNIKELVARLLQEKIRAPYAGQAEHQDFSIKEIAEKLDVQAGQVKAALAKLNTETLVKQLRSGFWCWNEKEKVSMDVSRFDETEDPNKGLSEEAMLFLVRYLTDRPEGASTEQLRGAGYDAVIISEGIRLDIIWQDARGFYHATVRGSAEVDQRAAE